MSLWNSISHSGIPLQIFPQAPCGSCRHIHGRTPTSAFLGLPEMQRGISERTLQRLLGRSFPQVWKNPDPGAFAHPSSIIMSAIYIGFVSVERGVRFFRPALTLPRRYTVPHRLYGLYAALYSVCPVMYTARTATQGYEHREGKRQRCSREREVRSVCATAPTRAAWCLPVMLGPSNVLRSAGRSMSKR
jgi:hypothetical protein